MLSIMAGPDDNGCPTSGQLEEIYFVDPIWINSTE